jgi:5-methylcytosine-specific restriction endonuclease McrA
MKPPSCLEKHSFEGSLRGPIWFAVHELIGKDVYDHAHIILAALAWRNGWVRADEDYLAKVLPVNASKDFADLFGYLHLLGWVLDMDRLVHPKSLAMRNELIARLNARNARQARQGIRPKTRFKILKKAGFACSYCGAKAPNAQLVVDLFKRRTRTQVLNAERVRKHRAKKAGK